MALDVGMPKAHPDPTELPGEITVTTPLAASTIQSRARVCYSIDNTDPVVFEKSSGQTVKEICDEPVEVTPVQRDHKKILKLRKKPEDAPNLAMVSIQLVIQEVDDDSNPIGPPILRSCMISFL